ncbi:hypothetical protein KVR01_000329 [Diaporthe batatas]|uniref:uncharacterized protein n=1 Tax=Diaporthe batatas TaxID=748121 RepID=UPI001D0366AD|nr:uncharacterized protein KVR01_000329 [Diaporthe batatas]KAG8169584.1 hypothetical protein KVR01_000329 [Diaporthe batatas]
MQPRNPQDSSLFLERLPLEIRLEIYSYVFHSVRLAFGRISTQINPISPTNTLTGHANISSVQMRPPPNSLSLLHVCRKVNREIGHSWINQVLFSFEGAHTMLEKLAALEPSLLSRLRHMRISGPSPMLSIESDPPTIEYGWAYVFKALPGLCLDRLTVVGSHAPTATTDLLIAEQLIKQSDGWRKLYFISHNSAILELTRQVRHHDHWHAVPRLSRLDRALVRRDGPTALVRFYRSIHAADHGLMTTEPATREAMFRRGPQNWKAYCAPRDAALSQREEMEKGVLLIAHRGRDVNYTVEPLPSGIKNVKVLKRRKRPNNRQMGVMVDTYKHVDDYE